MEQKHLAILAQRIKAERFARNMSQDELAHDARISLATLSRIENGRTSPSMDVLEALAKYFGVTVYGLMEDEVAKERVNLLKRPEEKLALGRRIKSLMLTKGLTTEQLAAKTDLKQSTLYSYLNGQRAPDSPTLAKISRVFGLEPYDLLKQETKQNDALPVQVNETSADQILRLERKLEELQKEVVRGFAIIETLLRSKER